MGKDLVNEDYPSPFSNQTCCSPCLGCSSHIQQFFCPPSLTTLWPRTLQIGVLAQCYQNLLPKPSTARPLFYIWVRHLYSVFKIVWLCSAGSRNSFMLFGTSWAFNVLIPWTWTLKWLQTVTDLTREETLLCFCLCAPTAALSPRCHGLCAMINLKMLLTNWFFSATIEKPPPCTLFQITACQAARAGWESDRYKQTGFHSQGLQV